MSHVTLEQAKRLKGLGMFNESLRKQNLCIDKVPDDLLFYPSAEELMEWLPKGIPHEWNKNEEAFLQVHFDHTGVYVGYNLSDGYLSPEFKDSSLIDALFQAACWVLEQKNLAP